LLRPWFLIQLSTTATVSSACTILDRVDDLSWPALDREVVEAKYVLVDVLPLESYDKTAWATNTNRAARAGCGSFLARESPGRIAGDAVGGLLPALPWAPGNPAAV